MLTNYESWVCEILSPSTADRHLRHKLRGYHRAHVGHYRVIEPADQILTVYRWQESRYTTAMRARAGEHVRAEPFDAIELALASIFDIPPPARARWMIERRAALESPGRARGSRR